MKQIGLASLQYAQDYNEHLPPLTVGTKANGEIKSWRNALQPFIPYKDAPLWQCPANSAAKSDTVAFDGFPIGYDVINGGPIQRGKPLEMSAMKSPKTTILAFEENGENAQAQQIGAPWDKDDGNENWTNILFAGHLGMSNYLFLDGHVKAMRPLMTIGNKINMWNAHNAAPVSPRALQKLQAAQKNADENNFN